jgi:hypothetical protein
MDQASIEDVDDCMKKLICVASARVTQDKGFTNGQQGHVENHT